MIKLKITDKLSLQYKSLGRPTNLGKKFKMKSLGRPTKGRCQQEV